MHIYIKRDRLVMGGFFFRGGGNKTWFNFAPIYVCVVCISFFCVQIHIRVHMYLLAYNDTSAYHLIVIPQIITYVVIYLYIDKVIFFFINYWAYSWVIIHRSM